MKPSSLISILAMVFCTMFFNNFSFAGDGSFCGVLNHVEGSEDRGDGKQCECDKPEVTIIVNPPPIPLGGLGGSVSIGGSGPGGSIVIGGGGSSSGNVCYESIIHIPPYDDPKTPGPALIVFVKYTPGSKSIGSCDKSDCPGFWSGLFGFGGAAVCDYNTFNYGEYPLYKIVGNCTGGGPLSGGPTTGGPGTPRPNGPSTGGPWRPGENPPPTGPHGPVTGTGWEPAG